MSSILAYVEPHSLLTKLLLIGSPFFHTKNLFFTQKIGKKELPQNHTKLTFFTQMYVLTESLFFGVLQYLRTQSNLYYQIVCLGMVFNGPKTRNRRQS